MLSATIMAAAFILTVVTLVAIVPALCLPLTRPELALTPILFTFLANIGRACLHIHRFRLYIYRGAIYAWDANVHIDVDTSCHGWEARCHQYCAGHYSCGDGEIFFHFRLLQKCCI